MKNEKLSTALATDFDKTASELLETVFSIPEDMFNEIPFEGSWSAAQVADHIRKTIKGAIFAMNGGTKSPEREMDKNVELMKSIFLNFDVKLTSPESVFPSSEKLDKLRIYNSLKEKTEDISKAINTLDLSFISPIPFPKIGELSRYEWMVFATFHTQRHIRQLKNIKKHLKAKALL